MKILIISALMALGSIAGLQANTTTCSCCDCSACDCATCACCDCGTACDCD